GGLDDDAAELAAAGQPQGDGVDGAEQPVAADGEAKEVGVVGAAAGADGATGVDENKRLDVGDERFHAEAAAVDVGGQRAADAEAVGAGLLLGDGPGGDAGAFVEVGGLVGVEEPDQLGPLDAGLDLDPPRSPVKAQDPVQP